MWRVYLRLMDHNKDCTSQLLTTLYRWMFSLLFFKVSPITVCKKQKKCEGVCITLKKPTRAIFFSFIQSLFNGQFSGWASLSSRRCSWCSFSEWKKKTDFLVANSAYIRKKTFSITIRTMLFNTFEKIFIVYLVKSLFFFFLQFLQGRRSRPVMFFLSLENFTIGIILIASSIEFL